MGKSPVRRGGDGGGDGGTRDESKAHKKVCTQKMPEILVVPNSY